MVKTRNSVSRDSRRRVVSLPQVRIIVAWVADEFPGALGNDCGNAAEEFFVERAGHDDAKRAIGSQQALSSRGVAELAGKSAQNLYLGIARPETGPRQQFARLQRFARAERITHGAHSASPRGAQQRPQYCRKQVRMFMGIQVGDDDASRLQLANLRARLRFNLAFVEATGERTGSE